ncbi:MAG: nitronate monooxygenase [Candidatus Lokiarchaeota archaeon]|nr:nitronate monooxygenase [Candidatus Lokiarchaeota archaeon]
MHTPFNDIYHTRHPIIQAGMGPYDTTKLAAAVARAGGLGLISTVGMGSFNMPGIGEFKYSAIFGDDPPEKLLEKSIDIVLREIEAVPDAKFGINIPVSEEFIPTASRLIKYVIDRVKADPAVKEKCTAIVTSAGDPLPWSVDPGDKKLPTSIPIKAELPGIVWTHVVPSVRAARRCEKAGVDVIVASGREGGAHCSWRDTSTMVLVPEVVQAVNKPVVAAGGFCDGGSLVAALAMGAIGIQMGTRMIATKESDFEHSWKELLTKATEEDTLVARGFFGPMRFVRNKRAVELVDATVRGAPDLYKGNPTGSTQEIIDLEVSGLENLFKGKIDETPVLGGQVAGRIHDIPTVKELVDRIMAGAEATLERIQRFK